MRSLYVRTEFLSIDWKSPTVVRARPLLIELIEYLGDERIDRAKRERAAALLVDLLEPLDVTTIEVRMPADGRARTVAEALIEHPAENRTLASWGREVGASGRTLERVFLSETGIPFSRWRTLARLNAALPLLASGRAISHVAPEVGYEFDQRIRRCVSARGRAHSDGLLPSHMNRASTAARATSSMVNTTPSMDVG